MRIELNSGGLKGNSTLSDLQTDMNGLIKQENAVLSVFQAVRSQTKAINGGVGSLQTAVDQIASRIKTEQTKLDHLKDVQKQTNQFIEHTRNTDQKVATLVNGNHQKFDALHPWAKPTPKAIPKEKNFFQKALSFLNEKANEKYEQIQHLFADMKNAWNLSLATFQKGIDKIKQFCADHKQTIIKVGISAGTVALLAGLTVFTGGAAWAVAGLAGALSGGAINVLFNTAFNAISGKTKEEIMSGWDDSLLSGVIGGAILGSTGSIIQSAFNSGSLGICEELSTQLKFIGTNALSSATATEASEMATSFFDDWKISLDEWKNIRNATLLSGVMSGIDQSLTAGVALGLEGHLGKEKLEWVKKYVFPIPEKTKDQNMKIEEKFFTKEYFQKLRTNTWNDFKDEMLKKSVYNGRTYIENFMVNVSSKIMEGHGETQPITSPTF